MWQRAGAITERRTCLVHSTFELADDADVGRPGDNEWYVEVDDEGSQNVGRVRVWTAGR